MSDNIAPDIRVHPDFAHPEDVVVQSTDGVRFYVAAVDLVRSSAAYRKAPLQTTSGAIEPQLISSDENATILEFLLKVATGRSPPLDLLVTTDAIEEVHFAAERLQMDIAVTMAMLLLRSKVMEMTDDPVKQYAVASRYGWTDLQSVFLARAITVAIDFANVPLMPVDALGHLVAQREARIAHFVKVMTWTDQPNFQFHRENNNICPTCILTNRTTTLLPALQVIWRTFQINAMVRFRSVPSLEHLTEYEWVARDLVVMGEAKAQCGHNPWKGIEKKIPRILETIAPV